MSELMKFLVVGNQSFEICDAAARAGIGSPLMAETVAEMTDTDKVYVYVGDETGYENGHWYYYDGSDWQDGGIYNSAAIQLDTTLSVAGEAADAKAVGDALAEKANIDGEYESMTVGNAEQLVATVGENNKTPYNFRTSGGSIDIGDREVDKLVGGTVAWNQLVRMRTDSQSYSGITVSIDATGTTSLSGISTGGYANISDMITITANHKYFIRMVKVANPNNLEFNWGCLNVNGVATNKNLADSAIIVSSNSTVNSTTGISAFSANTDFTGVKIKVICIDLTVMFGSTIADYIYTLEQGTAGAGVAYFRKLFPNDYYAYNAGELMSVKTSAHVMTGFNQFDKSTVIEGKYVDGSVERSNANYAHSDYIPAFPDTVYYVSRTGATDIAGLMYAYDSNKNLIGLVTSYGSTNLRKTPQNTSYIIVNIKATEIDDLCINLHWDGERDGEYEPYKKYSYALDSDLELRGIPKLDANNQLYYDGDTYESDGTVTRNYEYRAYASGDESLPDTITDGTHTVTKLTTPTTETADTYQNPQIVDDWGTEEYVDSRAVKIPVGHDTMYQTNLRAKLEMMPNLPEVNGDYLLRQSASGAEYVAHTSPIPVLPSEDGTYVLKCTVASGTATLSWEVQS